MKVDSKNTNDEKKFILYSCEHLNTANIGYIFNIPKFYANYFQIYDIEHLN